MSDCIKSNWALLVCYHIEANDIAETPTMKTCILLLPIATNIILVKPMFGHGQFFDQRILPDRLERTSCSRDAQTMVNTKRDVEDRVVSKMGDSGSIRPAEIGRPDSSPNDPKLGLYTDVLQAQTPFDFHQLIDDRCFPYHKYGRAISLSYATT